MTGLPHPPKMPPRPKEWWEEFFKIEVAPFGMRGRGTYLLYHKETKKFVGQAATIKELAPAATAYLDELFEKNVLDSEIKNK